MKLLLISTARAVGVALLVGAATYGCGSSATSPSCTDNCPPDPESEQIELATALAHRYIESHPPEEEDWDWRSGVLMFGLTELYRVTEDEMLPEYYKAWMDHHIEEGYADRLFWSDGCPPALTAIALLREEREPTGDYQQVVDDVLAYLDDEDRALRTEEGGISHNGTVGQRSVWVDSLFMFGMVLNRWGEASDSNRLDMESDQIVIFADVLQDDNGFMRHAQDWPGYDESVHWARGNSWVVASLADYLRIRSERGETDSTVEQIFRDHVRAVVAAQDAETGRWLTAMSHPDEPDNYLETSAGALFAYGLARAYRYGILGDAERKAAQKAAEGVKQMIRDDGDGPVLGGVSTFTDPWLLRSPTGGTDGYLDVPVEDDVNYGIGAVILALIETSGLPE
ncbi:MAG: glycoside hydrolase family 88 protein [Myxococcales bacterium]|nr:MAG: glycoside hydrolase family 88 protein [Myxococcales bacterium]